MSPQRKISKQYGRRVFVALTFLAGAYLFLQFRACMQEAQMSLEGASILADTTVTTKIINRELYVPPADSVLTMAQLQFALDVLRALDSLDERPKPMAEHLATLFNQHVKSTSEYSWIRTMTLYGLRASVGNKQWRELSVDASRRRRLRGFLDTVSLPHVSDSVLVANRARLQMFIPAFILRTDVIVAKRDVAIVETSNSVK